MRKINFYIPEYVKIILICLFIFLLQYIVLPLHQLDTDFFWHYKLGEEIVNLHTISLKNTMSFLQGTQWIPQEWLYEVFIYLLVSAGGMIAYCLLFACNSVLQILLARKMSKPSCLLLFAVVSCYLLVFSPRNTGNRPAEFSVYLFPLMIYLYQSKSRFKPLCYLLLGIFTANFHGGCILVMTAIYIILFFSDVALDVYEHVSSGISYYFKKLLYIFLFLASCCINPAGLKLLVTIPKISNLSSTAYISEWQPVKNTYVLCIFAFLICISIGYTLCKKGVSRTDLPVMLVMAALLVLGFCSLKAFIIFDIVWMCYGYKYLENMLFDIFHNCHFLHTLYQKIPLVLLTVLPATILFFTEISPTAIQASSMDFISYANSKTSGEILDQLSTNYTGDTRILASYNNGNYLILNDMKCFVDSRQWPYAKELGTCDALDDLLYVCQHPTDFDSITDFLDKYQFDYIWCAGELDLDTYLSNDPEYELILTDTSGESAGSGNEHIYERGNNKKQSLWRRVK